MTCHATHTNVVRLAMREHTPATMMTAWPSLWPVPPSAAAICICICICIFTSGRVPAAMADGVVGRARGAGAKTGAVEVGSGVSTAAEAGHGVRRSQAIDNSVRCVVVVCSALSSRPECGGQLRLPWAHDAHLPRRTLSAW